MKRGLGILLAGIFATSACAQNPALPAAWRFYQELRVDATGFVKVALQPETMSAARPALEDLRILATNLQEVPYQTESPRKPASRTLKVKEVVSRIENDATLLEIETGVNEPIVAVILESPTKEFFKPVTVSGSNEGTEWETLAEKQPIYRSPEGARLRVEFPEGLWKHLRVRVDDARSAPIPFEEGWVLTPVIDLNPPQMLEAKILERNESTQETRLRLRLPHLNLHISQLEVITPEPFYKREVSVRAPTLQLMEVVEMQIATGRIAKARLENGTVHDDNKIELEAQHPYSEMMVVITNGDAPALAVEKVLVHYRPYRVAFYNEGAATYYVMLGNALAQRPKYDAAVDWRTLDKIATSPAHLGPLTKNPNYQEPEVLPGVAVEGAPIDLDEWKYRKKIFTTSTGAQELELDPETLSLMNDKRGLRIVQEGKQFPYLLQRTGGERQISPLFNVTNDPERPTTSIWTIKLPYAKLPLKRLECTVSTPVFQRPVVIYEIVEGLRADSEKRVVGQGSWSRGPEEAKSRFSIDFSARPETDTLRLEIENGDNPPLKLQGVELYYGVTRLVFKTQGESPRYLYFGNPGAPAPTYDLNMAGSELLKADRHDAALGKVERLEEGEGVHWLGTKGTPVFFWAALLVVVAGLFFVISKLLPAKAK